MLAAALLLAGRCLAPAVAAEGQEPSPPPLEAPNDAATQLDAAVQRYLSGDPSAAGEQLRALLTLGPALPPTVRQDALAYLGDILYSEQGPTAARNVFAVLLAEAPRYNMDPFRHPPEVCTYFEALRRELAPPSAQRDPTPAAPPPAPLPWLALAPGGLYYFTHGRPLLGASLAGIQVLAAGASAWTSAELQSMPEEVQTADDLAYAERLRRVNWVVAGAGWSAVLVPFFVEASQEVSVPPAPSPGDRTRP